jgi:hypothetical protein
VPAAVAISSRALKVVAVTVIVVIAVALVAYLGLTFPRTIADFPVAFSAGIDEATTPFAVPALSDKVQVEIALSGNSTSWKATIENLGGTLWWNYTASAQENQTIYHSAWTTLPSGNYNFTFVYFGQESFNAEVRLTSKGGFW